MNYNKAVESLLCQPPLWASSCPPGPMPDATVSDFLKATASQVNLELDVWERFGQA